MQILENYDLKNLNTFSISVKARFFVEIKDEKDLIDILSNPTFKDNKKLFLGGGSNVLFTKDFDGIVVLNKIRGVEILKEEGDYVFIRSMGGEIWHDLVLFTVDKGYSGFENLSLIPGTVGAAPMQNIGAYGAELKDTVFQVEAFDINTGEKRIFSNEECLFGYRESVFKNVFKDKFFILAVVFKLNKNFNKNLEYRVLKDYIEKNKVEIKTPKDVSEAVSFIRNSKLPNPKIIGNAGSFFKNVFIDKAKLQNLLAQYPDMPHFAEGELIKIPTAWLIEMCGWKGKRIGNIGVHDKQALILVNYGGGTGPEIHNLAGSIINSVFEKFGIKIDPEVNLI
jgi:UDP-N-acetylmuramate dehydrogenase